MKRKIRTLLVDDEKNVLDSLAIILRKSGMDVDVASNAREALANIPGAENGGSGASYPDVVLLDLKMPGMDGLKLLEVIRSRSRELPVVVLTGHGTVKSAVSAMRSGAYEFLMKPADPKEIIAVIKRACRGGRNAGGGVAESGPEAHRIVGESPVLKEILELADRVAPRTSAVLVKGESGTGKELIARRIHSRSSNPEKPFVDVNCAAIKSSLAESLFFGYVKGAFTGADSGHEGFFQAAAGGTLFLDEIGDLPLESQGVLLRVLEDGSLTPLGETRSLKVGVRIISASNRDLESMISQGLFREDLFYRLNVVRLTVPPLRERTGDIPLLADHFLAQASNGTGEGAKRLDAAAMDLLLRYPWPGNVRELRNAIEGIFAVTDGEVVMSRDLPEELRASRGEQVELAPLDEAERVHIQRALRQSDGVKTAAAALLGIDRKRLQRKMKRLGLQY